MIRKSLGALALAATVLTFGCQGAAPSAPATGQVQASEADKAFIDGMVPHHELAVMMADDALAKASHAELKPFAEQVKRDQAAEIAQMKDWRRQWFGSEQTPMMNHGEMKAIAAGSAYDVDWANEMIIHHQGAIEMASQALGAASRPETKALAQRIIDAQKQEQEQLRAWIRAWGGTPKS